MLVWLVCTTTIFVILAFIFLDLRNASSVIPMRIGIERRDGTVVSSQNVITSNVESRPDMLGDLRIKTKHTESHHLFVQFANGKEMELRTGAGFSTRPGHPLQIIWAHCKGKWFLVKIFNLATDGWYEFTANMTTVGMSARSILWRIAPFLVFFIATTVLAIAIFNAVEPSVDRYGTRKKDNEYAAIFVYMAGIGFTAGYHLFRRAHAARHVRRLIENA